MFLELFILGGLRTHFLDLLILREIVRSRLVSVSDVGNRIGGRIGTPDCALTFELSLPSIY
jgi:hypothetical protein